MKSKAVGSRNRVIRLPQLYLGFSGFVLLAGVALSLGGFTFVSPWLRLAVGLLAFLLPGAYLFVLFPARDSWDLIDVLGYGFAFSVALITLLGLITRAFVLSIETVALIWHLLSLLGLAAVARRIRSAPPINLKVSGAVLVIAAVTAALVSFYAYSSFFAVATTDDQNRHHAAVNGFLRDEPLGWTEPYYETGNAIADRMYLTYWVLAKALVVEISSVPILLARYFINPFAMVMSVAGMYIFARNLKHGRKMSLVYMLLGLFAYSLVTSFGPQAGSQFFVRPLLDKVLAAFTLAPIAISSAYLYAVSRQMRALMAFLLTLFATTFTHSILGGFAAVIIGLWCLIRLITEPEARANAIQLGLLTLLIMAPALLLRLTTAERTIYNFGEVTDAADTRIYELGESNPLLGDNNFYAIDSRIAGDLTYVLIALTLLAALARRLDARSKLMLAYALAVCVGLFPYTAWIYGRLVSIAHVSRVLWLIPYGYLLGFALESGYAILCRLLLSGACQLPRRYEHDRALALLAVIALPVTVSFLHSNRQVDFSRDIVNATRVEAELLEIADYIDNRHDERVWVATSMETTMRSLAIALHWKVIGLSRFTPERMSYYSNLPIEQAEMQTSDNELLFKADVAIERKLAVIDRYGIDYLLFPKGYAWMVDALYQRDKQRFELAYSGETLRLVRVHARAGESH
ncbi:MAG: hypothetical protein F4X02_05325 [Chloroflexi bacterium]|nr:hypothetical protein [Chloroflexota bacterium]